MDKQSRINNILGTLNKARKDFAHGFSNDYGKGREDQQVAFYEARKRQQKQKEAPRMVSMLATNPTLYRIREALGIADPYFVEARKDMGMGLLDNNVKVAGQVAGTLASDLTQDTTRSVYWLLNALQATGSVINEAMLAKANPNLYGKTAQVNKYTEEPLRKSDKEAAREMGVYETVGGKERLGRGYSYSEDDEDDFENPEIHKRNFEPGFLAALSIPTGIAINNGLGLLTPGGGAEGYYAALPSEEDPTKTSNMLGEVALKYVMGRTGNILPYDEFVKVRPDVSPSEYGKYKAFKYNKSEDWNPLDGDLTIGAGALKFTNEGIHGPEVQFLGRSLPVTTGVIPFAGALAGGMLGVAPRVKGRPIRDGFLGGMVGLALGTAGGNALENERRRRNTVENELDNGNRLLS